MRWRKDKIGQVLYPSSMMDEKCGEKDPCVSPDQTVAEVLERWPATASVFVRYRTSCVGCSMAEFESLADVSAIYRLPLGEFLDDLEDAVRQDNPINKTK